MARILSSNSCPRGRLASVWSGEGSFGTFDCECERLCVWGGGVWGQRDDLNEMSGCSHLQLTSSDPS